MKNICNPSKNVHNYKVEDVVWQVLPANVEITHNDGNNWHAHIDNFKMATHNHVT